MKSTERKFEFLTREDPDTGARVTGYLASCQPSSGPVEFVVLQEAKLIDSRGRVLRETGELTMCPNVLTSIALDEGPRGRDLKNP